MTDDSLLMTPRVFILLLLIVSYVHHLEARKRTEHGSTTSTSTNNVKWLNRRCVPLFNLDLSYFHPKSQFEYYNWACPSYRPLKEKSLYALGYEQQSTIRESAKLAQKFPKINRGHGYFGLNLFRYFFFCDNALFLRKLNEPKLGGVCFCYNLK